MLIQEALQLNVKKYPDKLALKFEENAFTYRQLHELSNKVASNLIKLGLKRGDRVIVYLENSHDVILSLYGILKADGIFVIISTKSKMNKLQYIINNCEAKFIITSEREFPSEKEVKELKDQCPSIENYIFTEPHLPGYPALSEFYSQEDMTIHWQNINIDLAGLIYTSGSTGFPKGVTMSHLNIMTAVNSISTYLRNVSEDIVIDVLPLSFDYGLYQVFMVFTFGGTLILQRDMVYIYKILKIIEEEKVTGFPCVPTIYSLLLKMKNLSKFNLSHLRYITNTGAAFPVPQIRQLRELLPHVQIFSMYGLTECKRVAYLEPEEIDDHADSVGKAMPNLEVFIVDEDGKRLGPGEIGELVVRGASVMQGYWNSPEETDKRIKPGRYPLERFLYTGDLFKMDEEGYLYFIGRKDDLLKIKGERVAPKEIENVIYQIENIQEVAVVGIPDEIWGKYIKAYIVSKNSTVKLDQKSIIMHCQKYLESYSVPKEIEFIKELPKTSNGKIDKNKLVKAKNK
jgi:amino acid adenylation domain-containing protein